MHERSGTMRNVGDLAEHRNLCLQVMLVQRITLFNMLISQLDHYPSDQPPIPHHHQCDVGLPPPQSPRDRIILPSLLFHGVPSWSLAHVFFKYFPEF